MPSELFYTVNFSLFIIFISIGLIFSLTMLIIIITNRQCRTVHNLLIADLCVAAVIYWVVSLVGYLYGHRTDWYFEQPLCSFRAYLSMVSVAAASYSFLIQAISRLNFTIFPTRRFLLTWRIHWILIIFKWFFSCLISSEPFFIPNGFGLMKEYRMCAATTDILPVALYVIVVLFIFPGSIVAIVYGIILHHVRQLTRRVTPGVISVHHSLPSARRNLVIIKNIFILLHILMLGGIPYLILTLWSVIQNQSVSKEIYFISANFVTLSASIMMIVLLFMNKTMKDIVLGYFIRH